MSLPTKIGAGSLIIGTVGAITTGVTSYFVNNNNSENTKGEPIINLISKKYDYILLEDDNELGWRAAWDKYKEANSKKAKWKDELQLKGWPVAEGKDLIPELKEKCAELRKGKAENIADDLYRKVTSYCSRGVTFKEQAIKDKLRIADPVGDKDADIWLIRSGGFTTIDKDLKKLGHKSSTGISSSEVKEICKKTQEMNKQEKNYTALYSAFKGVCVKKDSER